MLLIPEIDLFAALNQCLQIKIPQKAYTNYCGKYPPKRFIIFIQNGLNVLKKLFKV